MGHKPGVRRENFSAIKVHSENTGHDVQKTGAVILERGIQSYDQRIFLEALHSKLNADTVNEHALFPICYLPLLGAVHMSRAGPANRADLSHKNLYFSTT